MKLTIEHDLPQLRAKLAALRQDVATKALPRALNRTIEQARTAMSREIREEFTIPAAKVKDALRVRRATASKGLIGIEASLESPTKRGRSLNLINFAAKQTAAGVTVKVKRAGGRKLVKGGTFIANKGRTVFIRVGRQRLPIRAVQTIDVAQMFNTKRINARVVQFILQKFPEILDHEIKFYTGQVSGGGGA
jgi:hypothetical protein